MKKGFTLIEVIIVIIIIGILSAILIPNYQNFRRQLALQRSATKLAQDIRRAQAMAMSAEKCETCPASSDYKFGWGVVFKEIEPEYYTIFADCNGDGNYSSGEDEEVEKDIKFEEGVKIDSLSSNFLRITFTSPDPTVTIKPASLNEIEITLVLKNDPTSTKKIKVNKAGLIDVD